jgi:hypothetical protein
MDDGITQKIKNAGWNIVSAAQTGIERMRLGNDGLLEKQLDTFDPETWKEDSAVHAANLVNRASVDLKNNPARAAGLLIKIRDHNALHPTMPYNVDDTARTNLKAAIEKQYKTKEQKALEDTEAQTKKLLSDFRKQYQAITLQSQISALELRSLAELIVFTHGQKPDQEALAQNLEAKRRLPENLLQLLQTPDEDFDMPDQSTTSNTTSTTGNASSSTSSSSSSNNNTTGTNTSSAATNNNDNKTTTTKTKAASAASSTVTSATTTPLTSSSSGASSPSLLNFNLDATPHDEDNHDDDKGKTQSTVVTAKTTNNIIAPTAPSNNTNNVTPNNSSNNKSAPTSASKKSKKKKKKTDSNNGSGNNLASLNADDDDDDDDN